MNQKEEPTVEIIAHEIQLSGDLFTWDMTPIPNMDGSRLNIRFKYEMTAAIFIPGHLMMMDAEGSPAVTLGVKCLAVDSGR